MQHADFGGGHTRAVYSGQDKSVTSREAWKVRPGGCGRPPPAAEAILAPRASAPAKPPAPRFPVRDDAAPGLAATPGGFPRRPRPLSVPVL